MRFAWVFILLCLPAWAFAQPKNADFKKTGSGIPPFVLEKVDGTTFDNSILKPGRPVMVMIVSPGCDHCEHMIDSMKQFFPKFKNTQIVLATEMRNKPNLKDFMKKTGLTANPLFRYAGYEKSNLIFFIYNSNMLPQINFYNSKHKLVKSFGGSFPIAEIEQYIN